MKKLGCGQPLIHMIHSIVCMFVVFSIIDFDFFKNDVTTCALSEAFY